MSRPMLLLCLLLAACAGPTATRPAITGGHAISGADGRLYLEQVVGVRGGRASIAVPAALAADVAATISAVEARSRTPLRVAVRHRPSRGFARFEVAVADPGVAEVRIGFVVAAPPWRAQYRVVEESAGYVLHGVAIVENTSGIELADTRFAIADAVAARTAADRPIDRIRAAAAEPQTAVDRGAAVVSLVRLDDAPIRPERQPDPDDPTRTWRVLRVSNPTDVTLPAGQLLFYMSSQLVAEALFGELEPGVEAAIRYALETCPSCPTSPSTSSDSPPSP